METNKFVFILLLYSVSLASGYPSKPLNERSPSLTWEAWLLIDDQNKQLLNSDGILQKQVTPKSIFIAPNFSPEYLPACAVGSSSDMNSQCIKIIKLDQDAHYEFLIERLKQKYNPVDYDDYDDEEYTSTAGPLQLNIPLYIDSGRMENEESREENNIAIILSPTKKEFDSNIVNLFKRDNKDNEHQQKLYLKRIPHPTESKLVGIFSLNDSKQIHPSKNNGDTTADSDSEKSVTASSSGLIAHQEMNVDLSILKILNFKKEDSTHSVMTSILTTTGLPPTITAKSATRLESSTSSSKPYIWPYLTFRSNLWRFTEETKVRLPNIKVKFSDSNNSIESQTPFGRNIHAKHPDTFKQPTSNKKKCVKVTTTHQILPRKNRGKDDVLFPSRLLQRNFQTPLWAFSRENIHNTNQFENQEYHRLIPTDDLVNLFEFEHYQSSQK